MKKLMILMAVAALVSSTGCRGTCGGWKWFNRNNECCMPAYNDCGCGTQPYEGQVIYGGSTTTLPGPVTSSP